LGVLGHAPVYLPGAGPVKDAPPSLAARPAFR
jgi:hypothetical protein